MNVYLIGKTEVDLFPPRGNSRHAMPGKADGSNFQERIKSEHPYSMETGQELIEFAGRLCYESFNLPSKDTSTNPEYVKNIVTLGHESVLEHVSVTFYVEGVSRNLSHELIRHRHLSFSELSQRFVDMAEADVIIPPIDGGGKLPMPDAYRYKYEDEFQRHRDDGASRKEARQAARYGLPAGVETKFVVSGNLRAWRDVLKKRWSVHADAEIQELAGRLASILKEEYPDVFADIDYAG